MLEVKDLKVGYGKTEIIHDLSLDVSKGEKVAILGANGAGKTTLLKAISGLLKPKEGFIKFKEKDISGMAPEKIVSLGIVHCPEERRLWPSLTVEETLKLGGYSKKHEVVKGNMERMFYYFPRIKERRKYLAKSLSGGEQQMVAIARALMGEPELLLLDEPSLGLAPLIVEKLEGIINEVVEKEQLTLLIVEQNVNLALTVADRAYILENGYIKKGGSREELEKDDYIKKAYLAF